MTQPTLAQPLGGWLKPADRLGHLVAFLHVHEIVNEIDDLASKGKPTSVYRDLYVVDMVDLNEGGPNAVVQRRIKVGHAGIAGRLDVENKSVVLGVIAQGEARDRNTSAPWILAGHTPAQGDWFLTAWWPGYAAQRAREGGPTVAQPARRVSAPAPEPQQYPQQWQGQPQQYAAPYQAPQQPYQQQQIPQVPAPQSAPPWTPPAPNGAGAPPSGYAPAAAAVPQGPPPSGPPPVAATPQGPPPASAPPQAVPHAWPAGAVNAAAMTPPQTGPEGLPPGPAGQAPGGYPGQAPSASPPGTFPQGPPPGIDPAQVDPATAALMSQMWPGTVPAAQ